MTCSLLGRTRVPSYAICTRQLQSIDYVTYDLQTPEPPTPARWAVDLGRPLRGCDRRTPSWQLYTCPKQINRHSRHLRAFEITVRAITRSPARGTTLRSQATSAVPMAIKVSVPRILRMMTCPQCHRAVDWTDRSLKTTRKTTTEQTVSTINDVAHAPTIYFLVHLTRDGCLHNHNLNSELRQLQRQPQSQHHLNRSQSSLALQPT